jgi:hypothetical protein
MTESCRTWALFLVILTMVNSNSLLVQQAQEDAQNMHKGSKMKKVKRHARKISARFRTVGEDNHLEGDSHSTAGKRIGPANTHM